MTFAPIHSPSRRTALNSAGVAALFALALGSLLQISDVSVVAAPRACASPQVEAARVEVARSVAARDRLAAGSPYVAAKIGQPSTSAQIAAAQADVARAQAHLAAACLG